MKPSFFIVLPVILSGFIGFAQFDISNVQSKASSKMQSRTLLVLYQEFKSTNALNYNTYIESAIRENWQFNGNIEYVSTNEFLLIKMNDSKNKNYAYLKYSTYEMLNDFPSGCLIIGLAEESTATHFVHVAPFNDQPLHKADLVFGLQMLQQKIKYALATKAETKELEAKLSLPKTISFKDKTLFIDQALVTTDLKQNIKVYYNYNVEFVPKSRIDEALLNHNTKYLFIRSVALVEAPTKNMDYSNEARVQIIDNNIYFTKTYETKIPKNDTEFRNLIMQAQNGQILYLGAKKKGNNQVDISFFEALSKSLN